MCYDKEKNGKESYNHGKMDEKIIEKIKSVLTNENCVEFRPVKGGVRIVRVKREIIGTISEDMIDFTEK